MTNCKGSLFPYDKSMLKCKEYFSFIFFISRQLNSFKSFKNVPYIPFILFQIGNENIFKHLMHSLGGCAGRKLDIAILGDISKSLTRDDLIKFRKVVIDMINRVGVSPKGNHFGLITFGNWAWLHNLFNQAKYHDIGNLRELVRLKINNIAKDWGTRTDAALRLARNDLFNPAKGDRKDAANLLFLFTDGRPFGHNTNDKNLFPRLSQQLEVSELSLI